MTVAALLAALRPLPADEVTFHNGQKLKGRVTRFEDPDLYLSVDFTDAAIPIRWNKIAALEIDAPVRVELRDGRAFFALLRMSPDGKVIVQEPDVIDPIETTRDQLFTLEERKGVLDGEVGISGTGSSGNLDATSLRIYWDFFFRWETSDLQLKGDATYDSSGGATTGRGLYAQLRYDYRFGDPAFLFSSLEQNIDRFADIESRTISTVGVGTYLANLPTFVLRTDLGLTYTVSRLQAGEDTETPGYRPSISLQWKLPLDLRLKDSATFYGNFEDSAGWQARNELMISREVFKGVHVNGGLTSTWDRGAVPGVEWRDDTYFFGLAYEF